MKLKEDEKKDKKRSPLLPWTKGTKKKFKLIISIFLSL
jgi:hypothetical protein